jgi:hypothetical protein
MPPTSKGRGVVVEWRSKAMDTGAGGATLRSFTVWAALLADTETAGLQNR